MMSIRLYRRRLAALALCFVLVAPCASCLFVAAGAAGATVRYAVIKHQRNGADGDFRGDFERVWGTTLAALRSLDYPVAFDYPHGPTEGAYEVGDVEVRVTAEEDGYTRVRVRVGTFENDENVRRAEEILERVAERLDELRRGGRR
jgi:hypothetical protein